MAPLRRLNEDETALAESENAEAFAEPPIERAPRWIVVSGLILYCSVFWAIIYAAMAWLIAALR